MAKERTRVRVPAAPDTVVRRQVASDQPVAAPGAVSGVGLSALLRDADQAPVGTVGPARIRRKVVVGAADDPAEHAADAMAARALGNRSGAESTGRAHPLAGAFDAPARVAERLQSRAGSGGSVPTGLRRSLEGGLGADFGRVRVHADREAGSLAAGLGAEAFTYGNDVYFGAGRYQPQSSGGQALLAHELAHVTQDQGTIRRKLDGTAAGIRAIGGGQGETKRWSLIKTDYAKILAALVKYEARERKVVAAGRWRAGDSKWMTKTLVDLRKRVAKWLSENDDLSLVGKDDTEKKAVATRRKDKENRLEDIAAEISGQIVDVKTGEAKLNDETVVEKRVHAMKLLGPRLAVEAQDVQSGAKYFQVATYSDNKIVPQTDGGWSKDDAVGGAMNRLDKTEYEDGAKGFFIADKFNTQEFAQVAGQMGIDRLDPNQGGRSVASSRLAQLFGADVMAKVDFATHSSATHAKDRPLDSRVQKLGVHSEAVPGAEAKGVLLAMDQTERDDFSASADPSKVVDASDPELQRGLNILQMLDYISRQLDRHVHNFFIVTDPTGKVTGIKGIDLDLSFGAKRQRKVTGGKAGEELPAGEISPLGIGGEHFVGMPVLADAAFRDKVRQVTSKQVEDVLDGLLTPDEVKAAVARFEHLQAVLRDLDPSKVVQAGGWNAQTAKAQDQNNSYLGKMRQNTEFQVFDAPADAILDAAPDIGATERTYLKKSTKALMEELGPKICLQVVREVVGRCTNSPVLLRLKSAQKEASGVAAKQAQRVGNRDRLARVVADLQKKQQDAGEKEAELAALHKDIAENQVEAAAKSALGNKIGAQYTDTVKRVTDLYIKAAKLRAGGAVAPAKASAIPSRPAPKPPVAV